MGAGGSGEPHFFLWRHGDLINLTSRGIPAGGQPIEINDRGQIAGTDEREGVSRDASAIVGRWTSISRAPYWT